MVYKHSCLLLGVLVSLLWVLLPARASAQEVAWQQVYGGSAYDELAAIAPLPNGTLVHAGSTRSTDGQIERRATLDFDGWLVKTDPAGKLLWQRTYGGSGNDRLHAILALPDGGFLLGGLTESLEYTHGGRDAMVVRTDALGQVLWLRAYGGSGNDEAFSLLALPDGSYLLAGETGSNDGDIDKNRGGVDAWACKLSPAGDVIWSKTYGGSQNDRLFSASLSSAGGMLLGGSTDSYDGDISLNKGLTDWLIIHIDPTGRPYWLKTMGGPDIEEAHQVMLSNNGLMYACGTTFSKGGDVLVQHGEGDYWVVCLSDQGRIIWSETYGGESHDGANGMTYTANSELLVAGISRSRKGDRSTWKGVFDGWLIKLSPQGKLLWEKSVGGFQNDGFLHVQLHPLRPQYLVSGYTNSKDKDLYLTDTHGGTDAWLLAITDPAAPAQPAVVPPTLVSGYVKDVRTGAFISAEVRLLSSENKELDKVITVAGAGLYQFQTPEVAGIYLSAVAPGYLLYSDKLRLIPEEVGTEVRQDILLEPIAPNASFTLRNIYFETGSDKILDQSNPELDQLVRFLQANPELEIYVDGHSDSTGIVRPEGALELSRLRAEAVQYYLIFRGIKQARITARGFGMSKPLLPESTPEARALNRRVEVTLKSEEELKFR